MNEFIKPGTWIWKSGISFYRVIDMQYIVCNGLHVFFIFIGLFTCSIEDISIECGSTNDYRRNIPFSAPQLHFHINIAIPEVAQAAINCSDICVQESYCEENCAQNFRIGLEESIEIVRHDIVEIHNNNDVSVSNRRNDLHKFILEW